MTSDIENQIEIIGLMIDIDQYQHDLLARAHKYAAFKAVKQIRGVKPWSFGKMRTDGFGQVVRMPMVVPECFGDIVTYLRWNRLNPIMTISPPGKQWLKRNILARCQTCSALHPCSSLGQERINSDPVLDDLFDQYDVRERRPARLIPDKGYSGPYWKSFADAVAARWRWYTMEDERAVFLETRTKHRAAARRTRATISRSVRRVYLVAARIDPLSFLNGSLEAEQERRVALLHGFRAKASMSHMWRKLDAKGIERLGWTWLAAQLLVLAGIRPTAGKVGILLDRLVPGSKAGEALRARTGVDLRSIAVLETPPGCWS